MNELIPVTVNKNDEQIVSGRMLHEFMEVGTEYKDWIRRRIEYGFTEDIDFCSILSESTGGRPSVDHAIKLDMAKELCMLEKNEKGKMARQYFIQIEKEWNSPEKVMARALKIADREINSLRGENNALTQTIERKDQIIGELQPKADYVDYILSSPGTMTTTQIAADYGISAKKLNKILYEERIQRFVGNQWILYSEHMNNGYTKSETICITRSNGRPDTKLFTRWTQKGRLMINEVLNQRSIYANMDLVKTA